AESARIRSVSIVPLLPRCRLTGIVQVFVNLYRPTHSCCLTRSLSRLVGRLDGDGRAVYLGAPHPPTSTILPLGGIPGSTSRIPTLGLSPNRAAPAPPGFITVTVLSTSSNNGRCVWPYTITSARGNAACSFAGVGLPSAPRSPPSSAKRYMSPRPARPCPTTAVPCRGSIVGL